VQKSKSNSEYDMTKYKSKQFLKKNQAKQKHKLCQVWFQWSKWYWRRRAKSKKSLQKLSDIDENNENTPKNIANQIQVLPMTAMYFGTK
jgi:hypothetical protein